MQIRRREQPITDNLDSSDFWKSTEKTWWCPQAQLTSELSHQTSSPSVPCSGKSILTPAEGKMLHSITWTTHCTVSEILAGGWGTGKGKLYPAAHFPVAFCAIWTLCQQLRNGTRAQLASIQIASFSLHFPRSEINGCFDSSYKTQAKTEHLMAKTLCSLCPEELVIISQEDLYYEDHNHYIIFFYNVLMLGLVTWESCFLFKIKASLFSQTK